MRKFFSSFLTLRVSEKQSREQSPELSALEQKLQEFDSKIDEFRLTVTNKNSLKSETKGRHQELLFDVASIKKKYYEPNAGSMDVESKVILLGEITQAISYTTSMKPDSLNNKLEEAVTKAEAKIAEYRIKSLPQRTATPSPNPDATSQSTEPSPKLSPEQRTAQLDQLVKNLSSVDFDSLTKQGEAGKFLGEKLSKEEFDLIKGFTGTIKQKSVLAGLEDEKGYYSVKKSSDKQGEHTTVGDKLPRSIVITEQDGQLQLVVLTKSKVAGGGKADSVKFTGGNTTASRALTFTIQENGSLAIGTVVHKTPNKTKGVVTDSWYEQASTDPVDNVRRAPNGMFVEDGGNIPIQTRANAVLDPTLVSQKATIVSNLMQAGSQLTSIHGDIKPGNILIHPEKGVRIIDFPIDQATAKQTIIDKTHFQPDFTAKSISDLAGKIQSPTRLSFLDDTTGASSLGFMTPDKENIYQMSSHYPLAETLGVDTKLNNALIASLPLISGLHDSFFVHAASDPAPLYNDSWGLLQTAEDIYTAQEQPLTFEDRIELEVIKGLKKQMLADLTDKAATVDPKITSELTTLNNQMGAVDQMLESICNKLNQADVTDSEKQANMIKLLTAMRLDPSLDPSHTRRLEGSIDAVSEPRLTDAQIAQGVQECMEDMISLRDGLIDRIGEVTNGPEIQALTNGMNQAWSPKALAAKMGLEVSQEMAAPEKSAVVEQEAAVAPLSISTPLLNVNGAGASMQGVVPTLNPAQDVEDQVAKDRPLGGVDKESLAQIGKGLEGVSCASTSTPSTSPPASSKHTEASHQQSR